MTRRRVIEHRLIGAPSARRSLDRQRDVPLVGELERVRQQVLEHLLQALLIRVDRVGHVGTEPRLELQSLGERDLAERPLDVRLEAVERDRLDVDVHRARFDLREVEDLVDQLEEVGPRRMNRPGELDLLLGEVSVGVLGEQLRENQQAVQRRPQLVRHVREELGLVARGQRELFRLLLERRPRLLDLAVLAFDLHVLPRQELRLLFELLVGLLQLLLLLLEPLLRRLQRPRLLFEPRVRVGQLALPRLQLRRQRLGLLQQLLGPHRRRDRVQDDADAFGELVQERQVDVAEAVERGELDDGLDFPFEQDRQDDDVQRLGLAEAGADLHVVAGDLRQQNALAFERGLADEPFAAAEPVRQALAFRVRVAREQLQIRIAVLSVVEVEDAVLHRHERRELAQDRPRHSNQIALPLQQPGELRQVRLQPILRGVLLGRLAQVDDHLVDVVLERRHLAGRLHRDRARQVPLRDGRRDFGDGAHLRGEVRGEPVDVVGEVAPGPGRARDARLAAQLAFDADLARDRRHLVGERRERVDHAVDRFGELFDLPLRLEHELAFEVAVRDVGHDAGDAADLVRQVVGHEVHVVGQVLPGAGDPLHLRLAAELPFRADLARHARDLRREGPELIDHRVDRVLQLQDLAADVDRDLLRQVAGGDGRGDRGDVPDLVRQVRRHEVDAVGQVLPRARDALHLRLPAQLALRADLARDARDFRGERRSADRPSC